MFHAGSVVALGFLNTKAARRLYHTAENADAAPVSHARRDATASAPPQMLRHFRSIQSVSDRVQDFRDSHAYRKPQLASRIAERKPDQK
jgi:hypothetical protein